MTDSLESLRSLMKERSLHAYMVPSHDEHLNEFVPERGKRREYLSGFTGSAGDLLVGEEEAWLFVDGRYHIQVDAQVSGTGITPVKLGLPGTYTLAQTLSTMASEIPGFKVGAYPLTLPFESADNLRRSLKGRGGELVETSDLVGEIWKDRPGPSSSLLMPLPPKWTGQSVSEKISELRRDMRTINADCTILVKLDQIAWLLNLRSFDDVPYNPIFESFLLIDQENAHLFLRGGKRRLPKPASELLPGVTIHEYETFASYLGSWNPSAERQKNAPEEKTHLILDPAETTLGIVGALPTGQFRMGRAPSLITQKKGIKNDAEKDAARRGNLRASVAKTKSLLWLRHQIREGIRVTERSFADHLEARYQEQVGYHGLSFGTISSTGANGAIIHYGECGDIPLETGHLFLIDSGSHIDGGSTDDTRTVAVGKVGDEERRLFTLVLRGHIRSASQRFPEGTPGTTLDALARGPLWNEGFNYIHGTGHGIGAFLNIHEGPFGLSDQVNRPPSLYPLRAGMITSIEPGYYRQGWGGIRIENLYLVAPASLPAEHNAPWLEMECLTWIPIDPDVIDRDAMDKSELRWLDDYHQECLKRLEPHLSSEEFQELREWIGS